MKGLNTIILRFTPLDILELSRSNEKRRFNKKIKYNDIYR